MLRAKGEGKIWLELHVAQGSAKLAGEGCTLDLPHFARESAARRINNH